MKAVVYVTSNGFILNPEEFKKVHSVRKMPYADDNGLIVVDHITGTTMDESDTEARLMVVSRNFETTNHSIARTVQTLLPFLSATTTVVQSPQLLRTLIAHRLIDQLTVHIIHDLDYPKNTEGGKMFQLELYHKGWNFRAFRCTPNVTKYRVNVTDKLPRITKAQLTKALNKVLTEMKY